MHEHLKDNDIYKNHKLWNETSFFDFMVATLMAKENNEIQGAIQFVKYIKDETGLGLKYCKEWYDLMRDLKFLKWEITTEPSFEIVDAVHEINSMDDLVYMVEHDLTINHFLRISKIKQIKKRIND